MAEWNRDETLWRQGLLLASDAVEALAACRTFPLAGRIAHRSWNLTV